jgi:hypothetical protein
MERETIEKDIDKIITNNSYTNDNGESVFSYDGLQEDLVDYVEKIYKEFALEKENLELDLWSLKQQLKELSNE